MGDPRKQRDFIRRLLRAMRRELTTEEVEMAEALIARDLEVHKHAVAADARLVDGTTRWLQHTYGTHENNEVENVG